MEQKKFFKEINSIVITALKKIFNAIIRRMKEDIFVFNVRFH